MTTAKNPFDRGQAEAVGYDAWYDSTLGRAVLGAEQRCVRELLEGAARPWLDLGAGSGRFGGGAGADLGLDPALAMLKVASTRLPAVVRGAAEALPFRGASMGAVLSVAVFEFLESPAAAMREVARVLKPGGGFVLGFFPAAGPWARGYAAHGRDPQSAFHRAHFFSVDETCALAAQAGLRAGSARSTLFGPPDTPPTGHVRDGTDDKAGFVALSFTKPGR